MNNKQKNMISRYLGFLNDLSAASNTGEVLVKNQIISKNKVVWHAWEVAKDQLFIRDMGNGVVFYIPSAAPNNVMAERLYNACKKSKPKSKKKALATVSLKPVIQAIPSVQSATLEINGLVLDIPVSKNTVNFILDGTPVKITLK